MPAVKTYPYLCDANPSTMIVGRLRLHLHAATRNPRLTREFPLPFADEGYRSSASLNSGLPGTSLEQITLS